MKVSEVLTPAEKQYFLAKSNWRGVWEILVSYMLICGSLALVALYPSVWTVLLALVVLGNRQLGLAILTHDASHFAIFKNKTANDIVGKWLCAGPIALDVKKYRTYHFQHHRQTGISFSNKHLTGDPDIILTRNFPCTKKTLFRWILKDLTLRTAPKATIGLFLMNMEMVRYDLSGRFLPLPRIRRSTFGWIKHFIKTNDAFLVWHALAATGLTLAGYPELYGLWWLALFTTNPVFTRIRSVAEHGMLPRVHDMLKNTRTVKANWLERITFAPHNVNYHLEHHFLMSAPSYKLKKLHKLMTKRGVLGDSPVATGYREVLKLATR